MEKVSKAWVVAAIFAAVILFGAAFLFKVVKDNRGKPAVNANTDLQNKDKQGINKEVNDYSSFTGLNMSRDDIRFKYEGRNLSLALPVYEHENRYYVPATEIADKIGGKIVQDDGRLSINADGRAMNIDVPGDTMTAGGRTYKLKEKAILSGNVVYLTLFDLTRGLNLKTDWDYNNKIISLFKNRDNLVRVSNPNSGKTAMIRLEDIVAARGGVEQYNDNESLQKLRIVVDYIYSRGIPFHVAWVPRFIDPRKASRQDDDLADDYSMYNADFVFTLDYMMDRNGIIGLHGYTHQYGSTISIGGTEFGGPFTSSDKYAEERLNMAMTSAKKLDIPYGFFEAPHYEAAVNQFKVMEKYFNVIYEHYPGMGGNNVVDRKDGNRTVKYIPAPLDHLNTKADLPNMIKRIDKMSSTKGIAGFFYHPWLEFEDIRIVRDATGYPSYTYSNSSILHRLFNEFGKDGYRFVSINDVK